MFDSSTLDSQQMAEQHYMIYTASALLISEIGLCLNAGEDPLYMRISNQKKEKKKK